MALPAIRCLREELPSHYFTIICEGCVPPFVETEVERMIGIRNGHGWKKVIYALIGFDVCFVNSIGLFDIWSELAAFVSGAPDLRGPCTPESSPNRIIYTKPYVFGAGHETLVNFRGAGGESSARTLPYPLSLSADALSRRDTNLVIIHPGSSAFGIINRWSAKNFSETIDGLSRHGRKVILVGTSNELSLLERVRLGAHSPVEVFVDKPMQEIAMIMANAGLVIANDSGIGHLAASVKAPLITIMGATRPEKVAPVGENVIILGPRCPHGGCYARIPAAECKHCIDLVTPQEVLDVALADILGNRASVEKYPWSTGENTNKMH